MLSERGSYERWLIRSLSSVNDEYLCSSSQAWSGTGSCSHGAEGQGTGNDSPKSYLSK